MTCLGSLLLILRLEGWFEARTFRAWLRSLEFCSVTIGSSHGDGAGDSLRTNVSGVRSGRAAQNPGPGMQPVTDPVIAGLSPSLHFLSKSSFYSSFKATRGEKHRVPTCPPPPTGEPAFSNWELPSSRETCGSSRPLRREQDPELSVAVSRL